MGCQEGQGLGSNSAGLRQGRRQSVDGPRDPSPASGRRLVEIWDYIANDSVAAADAWVDRLDTQLDLLATQPMMGRARDELTHGVRSFLFGRYVAFYMPNAGGVDVVRLLHSARDVDTLFDRPE